MVRNSQDCARTPDCVSLVDKAWSGTATTVPESQIVSVYQFIYLCEREYGKIHIKVDASSTIIFGTDGFI